MTTIGSFDFLQEHVPVFFQFGSAAERSFAGDPNTTMIKLHQLAEALTQNIAARSGIPFDETTTQADRLYKLNREIRLDTDIRELFYTLRIEGNKPTTRFRAQYKS